MHNETSSDSATGSDSTGKLIKDCPRQDSLLRAVLDLGPGLICGSPDEQQRTEIDAALDETSSDSATGSDSTGKLIKELGIGLTNSNAPRSASRWVIDGMLIEDQCCFLAGPPKSMKTSLACDLAVSVASGLPFLGHATQQCGVLFFSGESGLRTLQDSLHRASIAKGLVETPSNIFRTPVVPKVETRCEMRSIPTPEGAVFKNQKGKTFAHWVETNGRKRSGEASYCRKFVDVPQQVLCATLDKTTLGDVTYRLSSQEIPLIGLVIIDPLYMALPNANATDLVSMGQQINQLVEECDSCTPIIVHHSQKHLKIGRPMELIDLQGAGCAEFARQWILVNRRKQYDPAAGLPHRLLLNYGGSAGHSGSIALDIDESKWDLRVMTKEEAKSQDAETRKSRAASKRATSTNQNVLKLLEALPFDGSPVTVSKIRDAINVSSSTLNRLIEQAGEKIREMKIGNARTIRRTTGHVKKEPIEVGEVTG